ncbi:hypothetical protein TUM19329_20850 [Legionella antarctica]|uniref:Uncharacterized protein n=1 Tax=Legionella antarctica TaxID=2708020 RepID=A0A6F8T4W6_9GAMM|nr:hypothetical protein [Legionella antarctica]BCA95724.1 hypothetical protein TUM19329_20850 [Legionella antarctica]
MVSILHHCLIFGVHYTDLEQAVKLNNQNGEVLVCIARIYHQQGKLNNALKTYDKANKLIKSSELLKEQAVIYKLLGNEKDAILSQHKAHLQQLDEGKVPSLQAYGKWTFFKQETTVFGTGEIFRTIHLERIRELLLSNDINPVTIVTMREKLNQSPAFNHLPSIFSQLDRIDLQTRNQHVRNFSDNTSKTTP